VYEARCLSCGAKKHIPEGQIPPRCRHCWSPMIAADGAAAEASVAKPGTGLAALFETRDGTPRLAHQSGGGSGGPELCTWCGEVSEPGPLCTECGSPMLTAV
jgi:hypothetical protein